MLGFLPKNDEGEISDSRTEKHGKTTTTKFTGNDVTAWVEIKLDGYGWVAFYPTPKETKVPDENQNLTPPNPQTLVRQPPVPLTDPLRDDNQAKGKTSLGGSMADETPTSLFWQRFGRIVRKVAIYGSPLWTVLIVCGLLLAIKSIALARARRHGSASQRVAAGWQAVAALARQSGLDVQGTRNEQAQAIAEQVEHKDHHADHQCGGDQQMGVGVHALDGIGSQRTQRRQRGCNTQTDEAQVALGEDGSRDLQGGGNDQSADAVGEQMLFDDTAAGSAQCTGSGNVLALLQDQDLAADDTRHADPVQQSKDDEDGDHVGAKGLHPLEARLGSQRIQRILTEPCPAG